MATITIKIESEELAREVLTQLGYLPSDDVPDLISDKSDDEPEVPKEKEPIFFTKTTSSRDAFAEQQIKKVLVNQGLLPPVPEEVWCPEPNDDGFGTPIDQTMEKFDVVNSESDPWMDMLAHMKQDDIKGKLEKKEKTQKDFRTAAAMMKERLTHSQYLQFLEVHKIDPNLDPDIIDVVYELLGDTDEDYLRYFEEKDRISYKQYLNESDKGVITFVE
jgi:hypothetical protein